MTGIRVALWVKIYFFSDQFLSLRLIAAYWVWRTNAGRVQVWIGT